MYRHRFGLTANPLSKDVQGKTFFDKAPSYQRLKRRFTQLARDPGLAVLTAEPGLGKTAGMRNLCEELPKPDYQVIYLSDTAVSPLDVYRTLAVQIGVRPCHRRAQLWTDIKKALVHLVDERNTTPILILDEAQHLSDRFLSDLSGFLNFTFDSRDLLTLWLVGLPQLNRNLRMHQHAALYSRVVVQEHLEPLDRDTFSLLIEHGLSVVGATQKILSDPALEMLFRSSRGIPRLASKLLRAALYRADEAGQGFIDERVMEQALSEMALPAGTP
jgi:MSHA biogenesis protein MshM